MSEVYRKHEKSRAEWGRGQAICYGCNPSRFEKFPSVEGKVIAGINNGDRSVDAMTQVQIDYLLTVASVHQETTGHEVHVYTFERE